MSTISTNHATVAAAPWASPDLYRFTVDEYERMVGVLHDSRVELIDGYMVRKMGKNPPHIWTVDALVEALRFMLAGWWCRKEDPVRIPDFDEPEPDVAVVRGSRPDYVSRIPEPADIGLVIEVSETTIDRDRGKKLSAYARAGISVYWIVNLATRRVEVYTQPCASGYQCQQEFDVSQNVPVVIDAVEAGQIAVVDILPPVRP